MHLGAVLFVFKGLLVWFVETQKYLSIKEIEVVQCILQLSFEEINWLLIQDHYV